MANTKRTANLEAHWANVAQVVDFVTNHPGPVADALADGAARFGLDLDVVAQHCGFVRGLDF